MMTKPVYLTIPLVATGLVVLAPQSLSNGSGSQMQGTAFPDLVFPDLVDRETGAAINTTLVFGTL